MNSLGDLLRSSLIFPRARWQGKRQTLHELCEAAARELGLDERVLHEAILERERLGPTGVGEGVAIPHARIPGLKRPAGAYARLAEPADFESLDERRCDLVFMLVAPAEAGADHLRALARISRVFRQEQVRAALRKAQTRDAVLQILAPDSSSNAA